VSPARKAAFQVLRKVSQGSYASDALLKESRHLDPRDAALAHQIVFGVLRHAAQLDHLIEVFAGRRQPQMDPEVRLALRAAIFQLRYLTRIPAHAAVSESVEHVKRARKASAAGFVNVVLRKVNRREVDWPTRAIALSMPEWLMDRWDRRFGRADAERIAAAALEEPPLYLRIPGTPPPGLDVEPTELPGAWRWRSGPRGAFRIQDLGAQSIVPLLELAPGLLFLDLCAAPGNKTAQALETPVRAVACDRHLFRLRMLDGPPCPRVVLDAADPLPFRPVFDRILVDAPCSGTGTLARNPEIKWRLVESDLARHHERQVAILSHALEVLAPGGRLVYATCSLEPEENENVVREVLAGRSGIGLLREQYRLPGIQPGDGFYAAILEREC
jgi:16S rRNA (cytosine967-C5)-methyltransferase